MSELEKYQNLKRELDVIGLVGQMLLQGKFSGAAAQDLVIAQMYIQGLYKHVKGEVDRIKPLEPSADLSAVKTEARPLPVNSTERSQVS